MRRVLVRAHFERLLGFSVERSMQQGVDQTPKHLQNALCMLQNVPVTLSQARIAVLVIAVVPLAICPNSLVYHYLRAGPCCGQRASGRRRDHARHSSPC